MMQPRPEKTLRQRLLAFCQAEHAAGVRADLKPEPNNSSRVSEYLEGCKRNGSNWIGQHLAKTGGNWCAASQGYALNACALHDDIHPHEWRCGVVEMQSDAVARELFVPAVDWLSGEDKRPQSGDLALWTRPGGPAWWGHVNLVTQFHDITGNFTTIGGNEYRAWRVKKQTRPRIEDRLRGFILHPEPGGRHPLTQQEQDDLREQIKDFTAFQGRGVVRS